MNNHINEDKFIKSFNTLAKEVNQMIGQNRQAKTQAERTAVVNQHKELMNQLTFSVKRFDTNNEVRSEDNRISHLIFEISLWITKGQTDKPKNYKAHLKDENPSEIKPNLATNHRVYRGNGNSYSKPHLQPTKRELDPKSKGYDPNIKALYNNLQELKHNHGNRFYVSKAIRQVKDDLDLTISNSRGLDEFNRTDNEPTPSDEVNLPSLNNAEYKKFLITTNLKEIKRENVRLDKIAMDHESSDPIINDLGKGYSQKDVARRNHVTQSTVSKRLKLMVRTPITE